MIYLENSCVSKTEGEKEERGRGRGRGRGREGEVWRGMEGEKKCCKIYNYSLSLQKQGGKGRREREGGREGGCMVITGSEKAFAAGADIAEMQPLTFQKCYI